MMNIKKIPNDDLLRELYVEQRLSSGMIAGRYGCARITVCRHLRKLGVIRPESGVNSRNRNFRTKQYRSGYPVTFIPEHPRANHLGYVFDHILVVEKEIGRTPSRKEPIHHKDLDRTNADNNNLYLSKSHSDHQRVHSSLDSVASQLYKQGIISFKDGEYYIV